jgi:hypothetical protein
MAVFSWIQRVVPNKTSTHFGVLANPRFTLDARKSLCLHIEAHRPGARESKRSASQQ